MIGKNALERLNFLIGVKNNETYELSLTWINSMIPKEMLVNQSNFEFYYYLIIVCTITAVVGIFGRLSIFLLAFTAIMMNGMVEGIGIFDHNLSLPSQIYFILAFLPGTLSYSIDKWVMGKIWKKKDFVRADNKIIKMSTNVILLVVAFTYFTAGVSKLRYGGIEWLDGSTLSFYIQDKMMDYEEGKKQILMGRSVDENDFVWKGPYGLYSHTYGNYRTSPTNRAFNSWLGSNKFLMSTISILTVLLELAGFIVFVNPRLRNIFLVSVIIMHSVIGYTMGLSFSYYRVICVLLMDWKTVYADLASIYHMLKQRKTKLIYRLQGR
ncbi:hypothetical protein [Flagellimonas okinawensis]|uniref:HTTM domain-containing protein n=1 Tax=Flagellimonas okinawensis TaxID=3031324 RepID=A0ABT5XQN7_9FLAO|nr:hypothetical protein [[Muricauda] okinawensis]MDF0708205.1 hypothetical protein [[Muricauda] okinawensis]